MKLSFVGLGAMGYPIAGHLARKGNAVTVWNRTAGVAEKHAAEHGTSPAKALEEVADRAEVLFTCLPTSAEVDSIADRLGDRLRRGTVWVDATSGDPDASRKTAERLAGLGVDFLDAPVSGGLAGARKGTLTTMVGGSEPALGRARAAIAAYSARIVHVGGPGSGHALKAINNTLLAVHILAAAEGLLTLERNGIPIEKALEVLNASSGRSNVTENLLGTPLASGEFPVTFKLGLLEKDVRIGAKIVREAGLEAPLTALAVEVVRNAKALLGAGADYLEMARVVRG